MTARTVGVVTCNRIDYDGDEPPRHCREQIRSGRRATQAREAARLLGWDVGEGRNGTDFCPAHRRPARRMLNAEEATTHA